MTEKKTPKIVSNKTFNNTFRITKCQTGRADACVEYTERGKQVKFETCLHGAIELRDHFLSLDYAELEPKMILNK